MCVYNTPENKRYEMTTDTFDSLLQTVDFRKHRLCIINNGSTCQETVQWLRKDTEIDFQCGRPLDSNFLRFPLSNLVVIELEENLGTARGINRAIRMRNPGEHVIKIDNDVRHHTIDWVEKMDLLAERCPEYGLIGCKRKDLIQHDLHDQSRYRSRLTFGPAHLHKAGDPWLIVEETEDIMGTCVMHTSNLLDKIGYMKQFGLYGFDDGLMAYRSLAAGFKNCFLHPIEIDHLDPGGDHYSKEKEKLASEAWPAFVKTAKAIVNKEVSYYYDFY